MKWGTYYSSIRMASSIDNIRTPEQIAVSLDVDRPTVMKVLEFLLVNNQVE